MSIHKNKIKALALIKELYNDKNSLSVTLTGSYSEHFDLDKAGDIDIIIICKIGNVLIYMHDNNAHGMHVRYDTYIAQHHSSFACCICLYDVRVII